MINLEIISPPAKDGKREITIKLGDQVESKTFNADDRDGIRDFIRDTTNMFRNLLET